MAGVKVGECFPARVNGASTMGNVLRVYGFVFILQPITPPQKTGWQLSLVAIAELEEVSKFHRDVIMAS